jgi:hypothetical protein
MSDESFSENFMWYEWGFVDPQDLRAEDAESRDSERPGGVEPSPVPAGQDTVWMRESR